MYRLFHERKQRLEPRPSMLERALPNRKLPKPPRPPTPFALSGSRSSLQPRCNDGTDEWDCTTRADLVFRP